MSKDKVAVVDEQDNVIGLKSRDELTQQDIVRISLLWLENSRGEVLLQQRSLNKKIDPGKWGPAAAGTVESHETYLSNIIKEAEEEIGLAGLKPTEVGKRLHWESSGGRFGRMFTFYKATLDRDVREFIIKPDEVAQVKWMPKQQILKDIADRPQNYVPSVIFWKEMYY